MNSLQINEVDNEVLNDADQYLRDHKILELFEVSPSKALSPRASLRKLRPSLRTKPQPSSKVSFFL